MLNRIPHLCAAAALVCGAGAARGADWYTGHEQARPAGDWIVAVDASATISSQGSSFANASVTGAALGTLAESGPRVRVEGVVGQYGTRNAAGQVTQGEQVEGSALVGYEQVWRDAAMAGFIGLNVRSNDISQAGAGSSAAEVNVGVKAALQLYMRPTERTMVQAFGSFATSRNAYFGRVRAGWALAEGVYLGPEVAALGDDTFDQWRVGAHLSGLRVGPAQIGVAAGYLQDRVQKGGAYTTIDVRAGF